MAGPNGIANAISAANDDPKGIVVLASGWGAGQTGTALGILAKTREPTPTLNNVKLVILDNNTNRAAGGFWTTYNIFAPLLLTSCGADAQQSWVCTVLDVALRVQHQLGRPHRPDQSFLPWQ